MLLYKYNILLPCSCLGSALPRKLGNASRHDSVTICRIHTITYVVSQRLAPRITKLSIIATTQQPNLLL